MIRKWRIQNEIPKRSKATSDRLGTSDQSTIGYRLLILNGYLQ